MKNNFFKKENNLKINSILKLLNLKIKKKNYLINDIRDLDHAKKMIFLFFSQLIIYQI